MIATNSPISRLKGSDEHGILTIGKASVLKTRIWTFWSGIMKNAESSAIVAGHMAGVRYQTYGLREHFPLTMLHVSWIALPDTDAAADEEASQVDEYIRQHLEPPPLNYCVPRARRFR